MAPQTVSKGEGYSAVTVAAEASFKEFIHLNLGGAEGLFENGRMTAGTFNPVRMDFVIE